MQSFIRALKRRPIIAAVRDEAGLERALLSPSEAVFLLGASILTLQKNVDLIREHSKYAFIHLDLCEGLGRDTAAVDWCAEVVRPDGIISTKTPLLRRASKHGLTTIQRLFIMDSGAIHHGVKLLNANLPDLVEVLPGLLPKAITSLGAAIDRPIIAGGMITEPEEVMEALRAGAHAVSSSRPELWNITLP